MVTNVKMQVTPDLSERVQAIVFANGGSWKSGSKYVHFIDKPFLYISKEAYLSFDIDQEFYKRSTVKEISAYDFIASQGEQKWLPKFGEEVKCSDDKEWSRCYFCSYTPELRFPFVVSTTRNFYNGQIAYFKYCQPLKGTKIITIDGKDIEISQESYEAFKTQFLNH